MKTVLILGAIALLFVTAGEGCGQTTEREWEIEYPYQFDIQDGSYAWIVTPEKCEKVNTLEFVWDFETEVLLVNGAQIYPPVPEEAPKRSEQEMEDIYGQIPIIQKFHIELGSWVAAVQEYNGHIADFKEQLRSRCKLLLQGEISEQELRRQFKDSLSKYPYSEIFAVEKDIELSKDGFVIYAKRPKRYVPYQSRYEKPKVAVQSEIENKGVADNMVRRIVAHYKIQPYLPHIVFICNGGPCIMSYGDETISQIEWQINMALNGKSTSGGPAPVSEALLRRIVDSAGGGK